jgi:hypothetical protein
MVLTIVLIVVLISARLSELSAVFRQFVFVLAAAPAVLNIFGSAA